jgi:hypothetical protein
LTIRPPNDIDVQAPLFHLRLNGSNVRNYLRDHLIELDKRGGGHHRRYWLALLRHRRHAANRRNNAGVATVLGFFLMRMAARGLAKHYEAQIFAWLKQKEEQGENAAT